MGIPEKIQAIKDEMSKTQINKATEHHVGLLKAKLAKLKREQEEVKSRSSGSSVGFDVKRTGDATVVCVVPGRAIIPPLEPPAGHRLKAGTSLLWERASPLPHTHWR